MSFTGNVFSFTGPGNPMRFAPTRGRIQGSFPHGLSYPSPFFDLAHTYLPQTVKHLFRFCRYYFLTNPLINAVVSKLSEYPITDLVIDHEDRKVRERWLEYFHDHLQYRTFQIESGLDYFAYGNCLVSLSFPFHKHLRCKRCSWSERASKVRQHWQFSNFEFRLTCPKCGEVGSAEVLDHYYRSATSIRPVRWNPEDVEIRYNDLMGESIYFYNIPMGMKNDVLIGKKDVVESVPQIFIQALRQRKGVAFSRDNLFHLRRPTLAQQDRGWGTPLILPVLKDTFLLQIMKKSMETVLLEHVVPLRILFPQAATGSSDPFCVSPDTLVETPQGLMPASEVKRGDKLRSHTGAWRTVEALKRRSVGANEKVFRFTVASLPAFPFVVSEEHPVLALRRTGRRERQKFVTPTFIEARELKKGDYVAYPTHRETHSLKFLDLAQYVTRAATQKWVYRRLNQEAAEIYEWLEAKGDPTFAWGERKKLLEERGWSEQNYATAYAMRSEGTIDRVPRFLPITKKLASLVGFYLAEGYRSGRLASFRFHLNETDLASEVEQAVRALGFRGVSHHETPKDNGRTVQVEDVILSELLAALCGKGFANKRIPFEIAGASEECVLAMLRGLFYGDGCQFYTTTIRTALKLANPHMALEARRLLLSFGVIGGVMREEPTETSLFKTTSFHLNFNGRMAHVVRRLLEGEVSRDIGWQKNGVFADGYVLLPIAKVEEVTDVPEVIGFQMEGDRSFCVAGVATHNSTINLVDWREHVAAEIARFRWDPNYIPLLPVPVGHQSIGGDGRALLMFQEMRMVEDGIVNGMGVPLEFVRGGACLTPDTLVFTDRGLERLAELAPSLARGDTRVVQSHDGRRVAQQGHFVGVKRVWRVRTRSGLEITGAGTHPLYLLQQDMSTQFTPIQHVKAGDYLGVKVGANLWPEKAPKLSFALTKVGGCFARVNLDEVYLPTEMTPELARLLGYLVAEGSRTEDRRISFCITDAETAHDFGYCVNQVFGLLLTPQLSEHQTSSSETGSKTKYVYEISRQTVVEALYQLLPRGNSWKKCVPPIILKSPREIVVNFLRAYFDGDGGGRSAAGRPQVTATSVSQRLLQELQLLLLNLGIVSYRYEASAGKSAGTLQVRSGFAEKFAEEVGFVSKRKCALDLTANDAAVSEVQKLPFLREAIAAARQRHMGDSLWRLEPVEVELTKESYTSQEVAELIDRDFSSVCLYIQSGELKAHKEQGEKGRFGRYLIAREDLQVFLRERGVGRRPAFHPARYELTYARARKTDWTALAEVEPQLHANLQERLKEEFFWDEVVLVEELDVETEMLDIGVEGTHSYQANGILCHNSWAGTNVSMRMVENFFLNYIGRQRLMAKWVMRMVAHYTGWPEANIRFKPFKMADDMQRKAFRFQLNQAGKLSDTTLLSDDDLDQDTENEIMLYEADRRLEATRKQQLAMADIQGEAQLIMMKYQAKAQQALAEAQMAPPAPGEPGDGSAGSVPAAAQSPLHSGQQLGEGQMPADLNSLAQGYAGQIATLPPDQQQMALQSIAAQSPELAQLVQQHLSMQQPGPVDAGVDMRSLPEIKPPRRANPLV